MPKNIILLVCSFLISGCSTSQQIKIPKENQIFETLKFRWGDSTAEVTETILRDGVAVRVKYNISMKDMVVNQSNIQVLSYNGNEDIVEQGFSHAKYMFSIPKLKVDKNGELITSVDFDQYINNFSNGLPNAKAKEFYKQPQMQEILLIKAYEKFCSWVCLWVDERIKVNQSLEEKNEIEFMGVVVPETSVITHHGFHPDYPDKVKLTYMSTVKIDKGSQLAKNATDALGLSATNKDIEEAKGVQKYNYVEAITDPRTLKPDFVSYEMKVKATKGESQIEKVQKTTYEFKWLD